MVSIWVQFKKYHRVIKIIKALAENEIKKQSSFYFIKKLP